MSAEVDWVLETIAKNWATVIPAGVYSSGIYGDGVYAAGYSADFEDIPLERIDRDNSELLEGDIRSRKNDLKKTNYVGATLADRAGDPLGFEYDREVEAVVGVRVEGLHVDEWGYVDPDGDWPPDPGAKPDSEDSDEKWGVPFDHLVHEIKRALLRERTYPDVTGALDTEYYTTLITNESPDSAAYRDYYRYDFDLVLQGDETLP